MDEVGVVAGASMDSAEQAIRGLKDNAGIQLSVYIPASLRGMDIESFSMTVAEQWKLGKKGLGEGGSKGLLLVIAPRERRMRLEVGYGLEGQLTDALSRRILDNILRPYLRENRAGDGIVAVVGAVSEGVGSQWRPMDVSPPKRSRRSRGDSIPSGQRLLSKLLFFGVLLTFFGLRNSLAGRTQFGARHRSRGWSGGGFGGGSFGGGGWGGGGGGFGGGGASSSW